MLYREARDRAIMVGHARAAYKLGVLSQGQAKAVETWASPEVSCLPPTEKNTLIRQGSEQLLALGVSYGVRLYSMRLAAGK